LGKEGRRNRKGGGENVSKFLSEAPREGGGGGRALNHIEKKDDTRRAKEGKRGTVRRLQPVPGGRGGGDPSKLFKKRSDLCSTSCLRGKGRERKTCRARGPKRVKRRREKGGKRRAHATAPAAKEN